MRRAQWALGLLLSACTLGPKVQPAPLPATGSLARSAGSAERLISGSQLQHLASSG